MKQGRGTLLFTTLLIISAWLNVAFAGDISHTENPLRCTVSDSEGRGWTANSSYARVAINKAFEACKSESHDPRSCQASQNACEVTMQDVAPDTALWQCGAMDLMAKIWTNNPQPDRDQAAIAAKINCEKHSGMPESCYINLITCKNLRENVYTLN